MAIKVANDKELEALRAYMDHVIDDLYAIVSLYDFDDTDTETDFIDEVISPLRNFRDGIYIHNLAADRIYYILRDYHEGRTPEEIAARGGGSLKAIKRVIKMRG